MGRCSLRTTSSEWPKILSIFNLDAELAQEEQEFRNKFEQHSKSMQ